MKYRSPPKSRYDQNLVADQRGRRIFFPAVILSVVLGLALRGLMTPQKVHQLAREAADRIHKDVRVEFGSAFVSLSKNGFPRLAVVISQVRMSSEETCWGRPYLTAEQIVLPISLMGALFEKRPLKKIRGENVEMVLRSQRTSCQRVVSQAPSPAQPSPAPISLARPRKDLELSVNSTIDSLEIDRLHLQLMPQQEPMEIVDIIVRVKSHLPQALELEASTHLVRDVLFRNYVSQGRVHIDYREFPESVLTVNLFGNWREGNYSLHANYNLGDSSFVSNLELKHIPAAPVISVLRNYDWLREDYDGRKTWVTLRAQSQGFANQWEKAPLIISDFKIEGDVGEVGVPQFEALQLKPFVFKPLQAQVRNLNIDRFLDFVKKPRALKFIGKLGEFSGSLELASEDSLSLKGRHSGLEFIFSNRGERELQVVSAVDGELSLKGERWRLDVQKMALESGAFMGDIQLSADREFKNIDVRFAADELSFSPKVQKIMSGGGAIPSIKTHFKAQIQAGQVKYLNGFLNSAAFQVDQMKFERLASRFDIRDQSAAVQLQAQAIEVFPGAMIFPFLTKLTKSVPPVDSFKVKQVNGKFDMSARNELKWKGVSALLDEGSWRLSSEGQWTDVGQITGQILMKNSKQRSQWYVSGHRDQPQLAESHEIQSTRY